MKRNHLWFLGGLLAGFASIFLPYRRRVARTEQAAWLKLRRPALDVLACPDCHDQLEMIFSLDGQEYHCPACEKTYPLVAGMPWFIQPADLTGSNQRFARLYDWFSWFYRAFMKLTFAFIGVNEETARREITDRLAPDGGRVLEVSIGPGVNLPYLVGRPDVGELYGLDISLGQLQRCQEYAAHRAWPVQLQLGNAERLPYLDNTFSGVLHLGGINFFNDKRQAIAEMIRVAKPGARILICDETEKGAHALESSLAVFKRATDPARPPVTAPVDLVPPEMLELRVFEAWKGWMYCIEFRKP
jgi:ubiquinone/menaquinone biosynthesis C-methylase UbiE